MLHICKYILAAFALFLFSGLAHAQVNAATCNSADIMTAITSATTGQTVNVPSGTCTWTQTGGALNYCKNITLQGAGAGSTIIVVDIASGFDNDAILMSSCASGSLGRITGFTFQNESVDSFGDIMVTGNNAVSLRVDHNTFQTFASSPFYGRFLSFRSPVASPGVVFDHNTVTDAGFVIENILSTDGASTGAAAWAAASPPFETVNAVYFEDNTMTFPNFALHEVDLDCDNGGSYVFRHNTVTSNAVGNHGYDSVPNSCVMLDTYDNTLNANSVAPWDIQYRGGMGVDYDNIINGTATTTPFGITDYRSNSNGFTIHDICDGTGTEDQNTAPSGTNKGWHCYEQVGMGPTGTNFASYPIYEWNNCVTALGCTPGGGDQITVVVYPGACSGACGTSFLTQHFVQNRDYYDQVASFTGATGIGRGVLASRPGTCTKGVAYWGTDTTTLYQCTATNTWGTFYQPFTYPHPLVAGFTISPTTIPANHGAGITLTLTGTGTSWNGSTAFSVSGVSGLTLVSCSNISATSETCSVTTGAGTGTATLTDTTDSLSATFQVAQAAAPTCDHITGSYVGSFSNKCSTVTTGTVILCWSTSTTPVSNGDGATCATGTPLANNGSTTISSSQTFNIIAGANGAQDSSVTTYVYTITTPTAGMNLSNGAVMQNGAVIK